MTKYLYGAAVQGIQDFIFKTSKLKEIIGASEIIEQICTKLFFDAANIHDDDKNIILSGAGNIKYIFESEETCKAFVRMFPKTVMEFAPGISFSQALVPFEGEDYSAAIQTLETLLKSQRNKASKPLEIGFMGLERARRTGKVGVEFNKGEVIDAATKSKNEVVKKHKLFEKMAGFQPATNELAFDIEDITKSGKNSWIAVIHADGNGIGNILQNKGAQLVKDGKFKGFSKALDSATTAAVRKAFEEVVKLEKGENVPYAIRPILIGGDDVTLIIRADLALDFTSKFLSHFEKETATQFEEMGLSEYKNGITACAGIAYIKKSYPMHYGLHLAELLCADSKKKVKAMDEEGNLLDPHYANIPKSALSFYKVQESFTEDLKTLKERTLQTDFGLDYYFGPYLLERVGDLTEKLERIKTEAAKNDKTKAAGKLRTIVSETYKDKSIAVFMLERLKEVNGGFYKDLDLDTEMKAFENNTKSQLLDLITLNSFYYGNNEN